MGRPDNSGSRQAGDGWPDAPADEPATAAQESPAAPQERCAASNEGACDALAADAAATIADLRARADALQQELRRVLADADNMRKRFERDITRVREQERAAVAQRWLPVVDNLDRALEHAGSDPARIIDGVRAVRDEAVRVLAELGFPRRDDTGEPFDPARHDAVGSRPGSAAPPGTVVQVVQPAYGSGEHQLRPALVVVADGS
jgi:molecular chaperone GrpE